MKIYEFCENPTKWNFEMKFVQFEEESDCIEVFHGFETDSRNYSVVHLINHTQKPKR